MVVLCCLKLNYYVLHFTVHHFPRRRTLCPSWPLLLSAILKSCLSTVSWKSKWVFCLYIKQWSTIITSLNKLLTVTSPEWNLFSHYGAMQIVFYVPRFRDICPSIQIHGGEQNIFVSLKVLGVARWMHILQQKYFLKSPPWHFRDGQHPSI